MLRWRASPPHQGHHTTPEHLCIRKGWRLSEVACKPSARQTAVLAYSFRREQLRLRRGTSTRAASTGPNAQAVGTELRAPQIAVFSCRERPELMGSVVQNITAALKDDPSTTYFCRPENRTEYYRSVLSCLLDWYPEERQIVCTLPPHATAVAYVYPRLREVPSWWKVMQGFLELLPYVRSGRLQLLYKASQFLDQKREDFLQAHGPFMFVSVMGVRPDQQGRGLGSALLAFICDRADAAGLHCYIEATAPRNRTLYERFGFQLIQAWRLNSEMPYTYLLSRPPRPATSMEDPLPVEDSGSAAQQQATTTVGAASTLPATPASAAEVAEAGSAGATASPARSSISWWQQSAQRRRHRFAEWRRQRQLRRQVLQQQQEAGCGTYTYNDVQASAQYVDLDEYGWWPLSANEPAFLQSADTMSSASPTTGSLSGDPAGEQVPTAGEALVAAADDDTSTLPLKVGSSYEEERSEGRAKESSSSSDGSSTFTWLSGGGEVPKDGSSADSVLGQFTPTEVTSDTSDVVTSTASYSGWVLGQFTPTEVTSDTSDVVTSTTSYSGWFGRSASSNDSSAGGGSNSYWPSASSDRGGGSYGSNDSGSDSGDSGGGGDD